jgi:hypothetical protein
VHVHSSCYSNYEQLGLEFRLYSAEVLFNQGLSLIYMGRTEEGLADLEEARRAKATDDHNVIDKAIAECGKDFTVFSIVRSRFPTYLSLTTSGSACGGDLQTTGEENEEYTVQRLFGQSCSSVSLVTPCLSHL